MKPNFIMVEKYIYVDWETHKTEKVLIPVKDIQFISEGSLTGNYMAVIHMPKGRDNFCVMDSISEIHAMLEKDG